MLLDRLAATSTALRRPAALGRRWLVLPLGLGLALAGTAAYAAIPGASGTISGCVGAADPTGRCTRCS